jgi:putative hemolysin
MPAVLPTNTPIFETRLANSEADRVAAQRLRYDVFVQELGAQGAGIDHSLQLERDHFDPFADHLLLLDRARPATDQVVGVYRCMTKEIAAGAGGFYCEREFDLTFLLQNGGRLLELGRSCLHPDYRGGAAMLHLWSALSDYVAEQEIDTLFGVASFHGTDPQTYKDALGLLYQRHLAPDALRVTACGSTAFSLQMAEADDIDRIAAVRQMPALLKAYLRLGGTVGAQGFIDHAFNTVDVCLILQRDAIGALQRQIYEKGAARG